MSKISHHLRRNRRSRKLKNRKGMQLQRGDSAFDIDGLSQSISNSRHNKQSAAPGSIIGPGITVGAPNDAYEKEADRTADKIVNAPKQKSSGMDSNLQQKEEEQAHAQSLLQRQEEEEEEAQAQPLLQRQEEEEEAQAQPLLQRQEEEEEEAQAKSLPKSPAGVSAVRPADAARLKARKGMGNPLPEPTRNLMESHFQRDFGAVRTHTDADANLLSQKLKAQAFTLGQDIYFNSGKFRPVSREGKHLLAHELTHVVQQNRNLKKSEKKRHE